MANIGEADSIDTTRVRLRPMKLDDAPIVHRLWTERSMLRWLWEADDVALEQSIAVIERSVESFETRGAGLWCAYPHEEDVLIAFAGFWFMPQVPEAQLVFGVGASHARRGFGREIVRALVWHGFHVLRFPRIVVDVRNSRGALLLQSLGFAFARHELRAGASAGEQSHFYAVDPSTFRDDGGALPRLVRGPQPLV